MPLQQGRSVEAALATKAQLDLHFKNIGLRDKEFHKQKLVLKDKELHIARKNRALEAPNDEDGPCSPGPAALKARSMAASSSSTGLRHARSCPGNLGVSGASTFSSSLGAAQRGVDMLGASRTRFSAGVPLAGIPAVHPGASPLSPSSSSYRRSDPGRSTRTNLNMSATWASSICADAGSPFGSPQRETSTASRNAARSSPARWAGAGSEYPDWNTGPPEEELLWEADEELSRTQGLLPRPTDPPGTIERLGDLMALLGPRYKTLPRGKIWEKAVTGGTTPLERQQKRLGDAAPKKQPYTIKRRAPEDQPDLDHEVAPRAAWLKVRAKERERHNAAH